MTDPVTDELAREFLRHVATGRIDDVRAMLAATPALVNATGPHPFWGGRPQPLHVAIEGGRREIIDLLLERGADVNGENAGYDHWSPLMIAINREDVAMRDQLLARGARLGVVEALMMADDARVEELLQRRTWLPARAHATAGPTAARSFHLRGRPGPSTGCSHWACRPMRPIAGGRRLSTR